MVGWWVGGLMAVVVTVTAAAAAAALVVVSLVSYLQQHDLLLGLLHEELMVHADRAHLILHHQDLLLVLRRRQDVPGAGVMVVVSGWSWR